MPGEQLITQDPVRVIDIVLAQIQGVRILDNAPWLNVRQSERLHQHFPTLGLFDDLVENLGLKRHFRTVGADCFGPDINYVEAIFLEKRDLHVTVFASLIFKYLDSKEVSFVSGLTTVVTVYLAVQNDRWRPRGQG